MHRQCSCSGLTHLSAVVSVIVLLVARAGALVPKSPSTALYLELLDAAGAPTWMARDVQQLVQLAASGQPQQQHSAAPAAAAKQQSQQQQQASSGVDGRDSDGEDSADSGEGDDAEGGKPRQAGNLEDDVDVDTLLAMAAAEVRAHEGCSVPAMLKRL